MGKEDIVNEIEHRIAPSTITVSDNKIQDMKECEFCDEVMSYEDYNEDSPSTDYICHILPSSEDKAPRKVFYCDVDCFIKSLREMGIDIPG